MLDLARVLPIVVASQACRSNLADESILVDILQFGDALVHSVENLLDGVKILSDQQEAVVEVGKSLVGH